MASNLLLFRRLTSTDFNAVNGKAQQSGTGGGAMHIALGVNSERFPIAEFVRAGAKTNKVISTEPWPTHFDRAELTFDGNPGRRNGEWRIADQFHHRHPAWTKAEGFPAEFDNHNRPIAVVIRFDDKYHARLILENVLKNAPASLRTVVDRGGDKGIFTLQPEWAAHFGLLEPSAPLAEVVARTHDLEESGAEDFVPGSGEDARKRTFAEVVRRQGQPRFRRELMEAYSARCAITDCALPDVLQAAHITPYRGPETNNVKNGLLLRADVHTLFDLGLLAVDPETLRVRVSSLIRGSDYWQFAGKRLRSPGKEAMAPSKAALSEHLKDFQE